MTSEGVMERDIRYQFYLINNLTSTSNLSSKYYQRLMKSYKIQIMGQGVRRPQSQNDNDDDIQYLLSTVRARENGLIFFLELFSMASRNRIQVEQYRIYKQQFLDKQRLYSTQIKQLYENLIGEVLTSVQVRSFWLKLKSILRVSLERTRTIGLLNESLTRKYQEVMSLIETAHEQSVQIREFIRIEQLLKKRTVEALITTKQILVDTPDAQLANKNRSQTFLKLSSKPAQSLNLSPDNPKMINPPLDLDLGSIKKLKSMTRVKKRTDKAKRPNQNSPCKKSQIALQRYERVIADVIDCRFQCLIDKKKTKAENSDKIYDQLFQRNIACHKIITKFVHNSSKLKAVIQLSKQKIAQKKFNSGVRPQPLRTGKSQMADKNIPIKAIGRPKTAKKVKGNTGRILSGQVQRNMEVK